MAAAVPSAPVRIRGGPPMPTVKRAPVAATDDWQQLQLLAPFPEQRAYELLRPVVLFGRAPAERAGATGTAERTLYRRAARFDAEGLASLFARFCWVVR